VPDLRSLHFLDNLLALGSPSSIFVGLAVLYSGLALGLAPGPGPRKRPTPLPPNAKPGRTVLATAYPQVGVGGGGAAGRAAPETRGGWKWAPRPAAPRSGAPGLPGGNFRTGIVTQREPRRSKIPALGQKMRRTSVWSLAQGGNFRFFPVARRKDAAQLPRFSSI
jgi:hypothetical protein